ncbi:enoyl-CoA hydratase [Actinocorallia lasiicapitis]
MSVRYEVADRIATVTLDRPEARNSLSEGMIWELLAAFDRAREDPEVRVVVLTGAGDRAFCSGADLGSLRLDGAEGAIKESAPYKLFTAAPKLGKPLIARLNGSAVAGGLGLAVSADLVIAADDVKLGTPEVNVGLWPMMIMAIIGRNVAPKQAFKLYYTGEYISAAQGVEIGLITEAVPRGELDGRVHELARAIAAKSPLSLARGRAAFFASEGKALDVQVEELLGELVELAKTDDAKEGITAFLEKRPPEFTGT